MTAGAARRIRVPAVAVAAVLVAFLASGVGPSTASPPVQRAADTPWPGGPIHAEVGQPTTVTVQLRPAARYRGRPAKLQLRASSARPWRTLTRAVVGRRGKVSFEVPTSSAYRGQVRVRLPAYRGAGAVVTRVRQIRVRAGDGKSPDQTARYEAAVLTLVNQERAEQRWCGDQLLGPSAPLSVDARLAGAARAYASRMGEEGFFDHVAPDGSTPADRAAAAGYPGSVGENIAAGQESPAEVVAGWLDSPGHCQNLMEPNYSVIGIGYARVAGSRYGEYWVQMFG